MKPLINSKVLIGLPDRTDPPLSRLSTGPQSPGQIALFRHYGCVLPESDWNPRPINGNVVVRSVAGDLIGCKETPLFYNEQTETNEFYVYFAMLVGKHYQFRVHFLGEEDSIAPSAGGVSVWDLTV